MPMYSSGFAAIAVAAIYFVWRAWFQACHEQERTLRRRVTYMLWVMASQAEKLPAPAGTAADSEAGDLTLGAS